MFEKQNLRLRYPAYQSNVRSALSEFAAKVPKGPIREVLPQTGFHVLDEYNIFSAYRIPVVFVQATTNVYPEDFVTFRVI